jgi:hypothetical protein
MSLHPHGPPFTSPIELVDLVRFQARFSSVDELAVHSCPAPSRPPDVHSLRSECRAPRAIFLRISWSCQAGPSRRGLAGLRCERYPFVAHRPAGLVLSHVGRSAVPGGTPHSSVSSSRSLLPRSPPRDALTSFPRRVAAPTYVPRPQSPCAESSMKAQGFLMSPLDHHRDSPQTSK